MTITRADLRSKILAFVPGMETIPPHPPGRVGDMTAPRQDCVDCTGTGWRWAYRYERYMVCGCMIPHREEYTPRAPYGDGQC